MTRWNRRIMGSTVARAQQSIKAIAPPITAHIEDRGHFFTPPPRLPSFSLAQRCFSFAFCYPLIRHADTVAARLRCQFLPVLLSFFARITTTVATFWPIVSKPSNLNCQTTRGCGAGGQQQEVESGFRFFIAAKRQVYLHPTCRFEFSGSSPLNHSRNVPTTSASILCSVPFAVVNSLSLRRETFKDFEETYKILTFILSQHCNYACMKLGKHSRK